MKGANGEVDPIEGVVLVSRKLANRENVKIVVQVALELRYGREDEELMGLQFCNEMILASETLLPEPCDYVEEFDTHVKETRTRNYAGHDLHNISFSFLLRYHSEPSR